MEGALNSSIVTFLKRAGFFVRIGDSHRSDYLHGLDDNGKAVAMKVPRETLINGPTSEVAGEMASNFLDDEANRRSIQ
ncbi:hypothetical protein CFB48_34690 [Burkholderia sp. AU33647]|nr:hypothetical protein CFB48_34690 [Burkholderia sp. AU33647]